MTGTKSGAVTSPDVAPHDERALADILGEMQPVNTHDAISALGYWPSVGDPGSKASVQTPGGRLSVVDVEQDLLGLDIEDIDGEIALAVETIASPGFTSEPNESEAFLFDAKLRGNAVYGGARYQRLVAAGEGGDDASAIGTYYLKAGRVTWSDSSSDTVVCDYRVSAKGDYTLVRFAFPEVRVQSAVAASMADLKRLVRHRALVQEGITSSTGFLLVEVGTDLLTDRPIAESWRSIDLHEGRRVVRTVAKFQQAEVEADVRRPTEAGAVSESEVRKPTS
jgi:hypothetical protein